MSNQHIQKQIDEKVEAFFRVTMTPAFHMTQKDKDKFKAFVSTVWEEAEKEMLDKVIEKIEDYVYLAPFSEKTKITIKGLREVLESLKQTT